MYGAHGDAVLRGKLLSTRYSRQLLTTEDGGTIGLDWFRGCDAPGALPPAAPVLLVLHGLTGMPPRHVAHPDCCAKGAWSIRKQAALQTHLPHCCRDAQLLFSVTRVVQVHVMCSKSH